MMKIVTLASLATTLSMAALTTDAAPAPRPDPKPPEVRKRLPPDIAAMLGESNFGTVTQRGSEVFFSGHSSWEASGRIRADGTILLVWTLPGSQTLHLGVYQIVNGELHGHYGRDENVTIEPDGSLSGRTNSERLYRVKVPPNE